MNYSINDVINNRRVVEITAGKRGVVECLKCGTRKERELHNLRYNSCDQGPCHTSFIDMAGEVHGDLTVLQFVHVPDSADRKRKWKWLVRCTCGEEELVSRGSLCDGKVSCLQCSHKRRGNKRTLKDFTATKNRLIRVFKRNARTRGLIWELDKNYALNIMDKPCHYCGLPPKEDCDGLVRSSIDRVDNAKGYTKDNVVPCCFECNRMKHTMSVEQYHEHVARVHNYQQERSTTMAKASTPKRVETEQTPRGHDIV